MLRRIACHALCWSIPGRSSPAWMLAYQRSRPKLDAVSSIARLSRNAAGTVPGNRACNAIGNGVNEMNSRNRPLSQSTPRSTLASEANR